jgi:hypothetical protein
VALVKRVLLYGLAGLAAITAIVLIDQAVCRARKAMVMLFAAGFAACVLVELAVACALLARAARAVVRRLAKLAEHPLESVAPAAPRQSMAVVDHARREALRRALYDDALRRMN